ncbi:putative ribonuclease H-like domain-containing protein, partial [Tanacetum coccineum]
RSGGQVIWSGGQVEWRGGQWIARMTIRARKVALKVVKRWCGFQLTRVVTRRFTWGARWQGGDKEVIEVLSKVVGMVVNHDKTGLGFDEQVNESEVLDNVFDSRKSDGDDNPLNNRFKKTKVSETITTTSKTSKDSLEKPKTVRPSASIIEEWDTDSDNDSVFRPKFDQTKPKFTKINFVKSGENVKFVNKENTHRQVEYPRKSQSPMGNRKNWNGMMTQRLGDGFEFKKKACFVCGSFNHLIKDCDFHDNKMVEKPVLNNKGRVTGQREVRPVWNNAQRVNHQNKLTHPHPKRSFVPTAVATKSGQVPVNAAKQSSLRVATSINTARHLRRAFNQKSTAKTNNFNEKVNTARVNNITTAGSKAVVSAAEGNGENVIKSSACWIWRPTGKVIDLNSKDSRSYMLKRFDYGNPQYTLQDQGIFDSGCSRHMTGNKSFLTDYQDIDGGFVAFVGSAKGDSKLPTTFWAEAVNTACYVQNRVLVIKPHNKTPYELFLCRKHALSFMRPFGCPVTILNTLDHLGKFDGKSDDGFFVGYSINSKAFRVFNTRTRFVEENLHIKFLENKPNVAGTGPNWMFDIDTLTMSMNYQPVFARNQTNGNAGTKENINEGQRGIKTVPGPQYVLLPVLTFDSQSPKSSEDEVVDDDGKKNEVLDLAKEDDKSGQGEATNTNSTNRLNIVSSSINTVSSSFTTIDPGRERVQRNEFESVFGQDKDANGNSIYRMFTPVNATRSSCDNLSGSIPINAATLANANLPTDPIMPEDTTDLLNTGIFSGAYDDENVGAEADLNNLETTMNVSHIPTTRIHKDHPKNQIIGDKNSATQTRRMNKSAQEHAMKVTQPLTDPSCIEAMQDELLQFRLQKVWRLVDLPKGKHAIGTKWVYKNKKDERWIVVRNKARLVAQGYTQEEGINYDEMDVKSAFLYGTIEDEVAWYETLSTYLLENGFRRGTIDKTLSIKKDKGDILLVQVKQEDNGIFISQDKYVVDILKKFDFVTVKTSSTPIETNKALLKDEEDEDVDVHLYRSMIGSLMYLTTSRPDIMFDVCACARFQVTPKVSHLHAVKRIFRYLKGQPKLGLWYPRDSPFDLEAFSDSDYAGAIVANSTTKAEYVAAANYCGQSTICIVKNPVFHSKTKNIEIRHHFIIDSYEKRLIQVIKIHTDHNVADLLTKAFDVGSFQYLTASIRMLNLRSIA